MEIPIIMIGISLQLLSCSRLNNNHNLWKYGLFQYVLEVSTVQQVGQRNSSQLTKRDNNLLLEMGKMSGHWIARSCFHGMDDIVNFLPSAAW